MIDMDVRSESEHIQGIPLICLDQIKTYALYRVFTKRNNTPQGNVSQRCGIQHGMMFQFRVRTDEEYRIWRQHSNVFDTNDIVGGFPPKGCTSSTLEPHDTEVLCRDDIYGKGSFYF